MKGSTDFNSLFLKFFSDPKAVILMNNLKIIYNIMIIFR